MKTIFHKSDTRGFADHGWLLAKHSFSFAGYHNRNRMHFGALRVLNDDEVSEGIGFPEHPHDNMEIITIPLEGEVAHKDSMGNSATISAGQIQIMSAGTGVYHSEYNPSSTHKTKLLQIWVFPNKRNVTPRYQEIDVKANHVLNAWNQIVSPNADDAGGWIHQDAWFTLSEMTANTTKTYTFKGESTGIYVFVIEGKLKINGEILDRRDGMGIEETTHVEIHFLENTKVLIMEVPMEF
jgi:redox-sensitive bicupin YhaK (pirin superfamily)